MPRHRFRRSCRSPRNVAERAAFDLLTDRGDVVSRRGWPDFLCERPDGSLYVVEVKPYPGSPLKHEQRVVLDWLTRHGVECYRYDPTSGLERIEADTS